MSVSSSTTTPKHVIGTVYLEVSYVIQEIDMTLVLPRQTCLTLTCLKSEYVQGYTRVDF